VTVATVLATGHLYHVGDSGLLLGAGVLVLTVFLGRVFCGWACPFGTLQHFVHWLFFPKGAKRRRLGNRYRRLYLTKYVVLLMLLAGALLGTLQIGLLDPIALMSRSVADAVYPAIDAGLRGLGLPGIHPSATPYFSGAWLIGAIFVSFLALGAVIPRFFCRILCPLGALLGIFSRFSLFRIHRVKEACTDCNLCPKGCEGAAEPEARVRLAECMVCMNCLEDCPDAAIQYRFLPPAESAIPATELGARRAVLAAAGGFLAFTFLRQSGAALAKSGEPGVIRPPGTLPEEEFLARCIKCDACLNVCPTNVLHPAGLEAGFEGIWTPKLDFRTGYCDVSCTLCGTVCPTGAIHRLTPAQRNGQETREDGRKVVERIGTAAYDRGRCLPWAMDLPCVVCEEVCPTSPKAIVSRKERVTTRDGGKKVMQRPYVDPELCVGCGICEKECPVRGPAAIRVGSRIVTL
jgi:polyferredoxin